MPITAPMMMKSRVSQSTSLVSCIATAGRSRRMAAKLQPAIRNIFQTPSILIASFAIALSPCIYDPASMAEPAMQGMSKS
jgi:hypothetical protein